MKILFVYPEFPDTFWSFKHALKFVSKKATYPPLGLLTVAALMPKNWDKKLVDINVEALKDKDINWADLVLISAMSIQSESAKNVISRCKKAKVKTVAGGPLFSAWPENFNDVDFLVLNEAELTLPLFLSDFEAGNPKHIYTCTEKPDLCSTPKPLWELINIKNYSSMNLQYSRGCPFNCEFCEIIVLYGNKARVKDGSQIVGELQSLYDIGWRGKVFFVDDNFIGNKQKLKTEILPAIISWSEMRGHPFTFHTEASINLADDVELMRMMSKARFDMVFVGIETPNEKSLEECNKYQNKNRDLLESIKVLQTYGLQVQGGFILGFDNDPDTIFDTLIRFIQESGIVVAMVGLLNAPRGTKLYQRLQKEHRITSEMSGNNTDCSINFTPIMKRDELINGYLRVLKTIYSPKCYYERIVRYLKKTGNSHSFLNEKIHLKDVLPFFKSIFKIGVIGKERSYYWRLFFHTILRNRASMQSVVTFAIYGYHFRKIYGI